MGQYYQPPPQGYPQQPYQAQPPGYGPRYEHADIVHRFVALLIDGIILGVLYAVLMVVFIFAGVFAFSMGGTFGFGLWAIVLMVVWFFIAIMYFTVQEGGPSGATIGKKLMHLKVVDTNYQPIDMSKAFIRNLMRLWFISGVAFIILIIDVVLILVKPEKQRIGDIVAHTYVVNDQPMQMGPQPFYAPQQQQYQPQPQYQQPPPPQYHQGPVACVGCGQHIQPGYANCPRCGRPVQ